MAAIDREAWDEFEQLFAPEGSVESRRKIVGFKRTEFPSDEVMRQTRRDLETGIMRANHVVIAVRGERLALARVTLGTADVSPGAPQDEFLQLYGVDEEGRIALQVWFDLEDMDAAIAELDAVHARFEDERSQERRFSGGRELPSAPASAQTPVIELDTACVRAVERVAAALIATTGTRYEGQFAPEIVRRESAEDRRLLADRHPIRQRLCTRENRRILETGETRLDYVLSPCEGSAWHSTRLKMRHRGREPRCTSATSSSRYTASTSDGRVALQIWFDIDDLDAAIAELDAVHARFEEATPTRRGDWKTRRVEYPSASAPSSRPGTGPP